MRRCNNKILENVKEMKDQKSNRHLKCERNYYAENDCLEDTGIGMFKNLFGKWSQTLFPHLARVFMQSVKQNII